MSKGNRSAREMLEKINIPKRDGEGKLHYYKDRSGQQYGRLTVIKYLYTNYRRKAVWLCKCKCGNFVEIASEDLVTGNIKSCGCLHSDVSKEHIKKVIKNQTKYKKPFEKDIMKIFHQMKSRCYNEDNKSFKNYGGRGIKIYDKWLNNPNIFYEWSINNGYKKELSIDRINVNGDYTPDNCRWITNLEQQNNKRNNKYIEFNGEKNTYAEWGRKLKIPAATISDRVKRGYTVEKILNTNYKKRV